MGSKRAIEIGRNTRKVVTFLILDGITRQPKNLSGALIFFQVQLRPVPGASLFEKAIGSGIVILDQVNFEGLCEVTIDQADTEPLTDQRYYYDVRAQFPGDGEPQEVIFPDDFRVTQVVGL